MPKKKISSEDIASPIKIIKAALYIAGRPLSVESLSRIVNLPPDEVHKLVTLLKKQLNEADDIFDIVISPGPTYYLQLHPTLIKYVRRLSPKPLLSAAELKTLALIALKQPVLLSTIANLRGSQAYEHVSHLIELGFIHSEPHGRTKILSTTKRFSEYFGLPVNKKQLKIKLLSLAKKYDLPLLESMHERQVNEKTAQSINKTNEFQTSDDD
ncbi:MAG: SMC-Scp complex subunit ScpB [Candidatus Asgardarchaeia archaeon]